MQNQNSKFKIFIYVGLCVSALGFLTPFTAEASSFIFKDKVFTVRVGETFTVPVSINPAGEKQYTARFTLSFPPDMLEVISFEPASSWIAVPQPGYDLIDNKDGSLIKTAGYPTGFSLSVPFGTVTFRAISSGEGAIAVGARSFILNAKSQITLASRPRIAVVVADIASKTLPIAKPLTDLPLEEPTLFDIISEPGKEMSYAVSFFILWIAIAILLILFLAAIFVLIYRWRRKWLIRSLPKDK